ncbi:MAG: hypothetical protein DMG13_01870 [Acidobacteria bacterium]|nr:MAG: hypothetical protein DMG13_01870 [Acidobacteriota bacterium]
MASNVAFAVFVAIGALGFLFLLISLFIGELFDHGADLVHSGFEHGGPSFFSTRVLSVLVTAFGGTGAIATQMGAGIVASSVIGGLSGVFFAGIILAFARFLYSQQSSSDVRREDLIGRTAEVTVTIPPGGLGQIRCLVGETLVDRIAKAADGQSIVVHSIVTIESDTGQSVVVRAKAKSG